MQRDIIKIIIVFCTIYYCNSKRYDNYTLFRGFPISKHHLNFFKNLSDIYDVNFWKHPSLVKKPIEFIISPQHKTDFLKDVDIHGIYLTTIMENIQSAFDKQTVTTYIRRKMDSYDWQNYFRLNDIYSWLKDLQKAHPQEIELSVIGKTQELRNIMSARVYLRDGPVHRATVIVEGGIHAREWISPAFVTYFLNQIVNCSKIADDRLKLIAQQYEWIFVPVLNPDGYEYSHTDDRLWRKNRRDTGVDINRNFGHKFGSVGVSFIKSSEIYAGETAFSEYESSAMRDLVIKNSKHLDYYFAFHSYGQYMIIPYSHTKVHSENFAEMAQIARSAATEVEKMYGAKYKVGTAYDTVGYLVSGASTCWTKKTFNVPYVMTIELRDQGNYGFALPPKLILPTCKETMSGMLSLLAPKPHNHDRESKPSESEGYELLYITDGQDNTILDYIVILCNVILFIIVRFD